MMKPKRISHTLVTGTTSNIAASQTPGAAGNLTLDGALAVGGLIPDLIFGYIVSITGAGNDSGKTFTITGFDQSLRPQTENVTGPNANTVVSTKFWRKITSIAISAAAAGAITVGTPNTTLCAVSPDIILDLYETDTSIAVDIGGTINYDVKKAFERMTAGETANWVAGGLTGQTADAQTAYTASTAAVRLQINSYTNGATVAMSALHSRSH